MRPLSLIQTAKQLAGARSAGLPRETNLRRAVSTTYYALFHCLAKTCADTLVGASSSNRSNKAWMQAYRSLQHSQARDRCNRAHSLKFPQEIQDFAQLFPSAQRLRERADYNPNSVFTKSNVVRQIADAERVIRNFSRCPVKDRRAFAVYVLMPLPRPN